MRTEIRSTTPAGMVLTTIEDGEDTKILMTGPDGRGYILGTLAHNGAATLLALQDHGCELSADVLRCAATLLDGRCATALLDVEDLFGGAR